jgi:hypothetical protein
MNGDQEKAKQVFREARDKGINFTPEDLKTAERILSTECCKKGEIF